MEFDNHETFVTVYVEGHFYSSIYTIESTSRIQKQLSDFLCHEGNLVKQLIQFKSPKMNTYMLMVFLVNIGKVFFFH